MYNTNKNIPSLSQVRKQERDAQETIREENAKQLLLKSIEFYNEHYPNSEHEIEWKWPKVELKLGNKSLDEELGKLSEDLLRVIFEILQYYHDERQMQKIEEHNQRSLIIRKITKIYPAGSLLEKLHDLYEEQRKLNVKIKELEDSLNIEREKFSQRLNKINENHTLQLICPIEDCGKVCKSEAGLASHMRVHQKNE